MDNLSHRAECVDIIKYFFKSDNTFEIKFARHVSVVQRPSSVESRINLKYKKSVIPVQITHRNSGL